MRNFKPYKSISIFAFFFVVVSIFIFSFYPGINSNLYLAIATFVVGLFAVYLYIKQQEDRKRDAANILLLEIRNAETIIQQIRTSGAINFYAQVLPVNSWNKYNYLFIEDLDRDELEALNNFYNQASLIDKFIDQVNTLPLQLTKKGEYIQKTLVQLARDCSDEFDDNIRKINYETKKTRFLAIVNSEIFWFEPGAPRENLKKPVDSVLFITTTTTGAKLKRIAGLT